MPSGDRKIGRGKRRPSAKTQPQRTERNKARNIKRAEAAKKNPKELKVPHGTARAKRRAGMKRKHIDKGEQHGVAS